MYHWTDAVDDSAMADIPRPTSNLRPFRSSDQQNLVDTQTLNDHERTLRQWSHIFGMSPKCMITLKNSVCGLPVGTRLHILKGKIYQITGQDDEEMVTSGDVTSKLMDESFKSDNFC